ncbi:hypothetical protein TIFTF001_009023 [Ficus carica]|uniref:Photolyase/cryptochrome alpha/beta domain-containing protein n=1 Tax=Ficus carica TaxID=3494 RepID=A0AA88A9R3_FICCA|nr:hypothetical protein TIFTF001_009023 [Ficus carica]
MASISGSDSAAGPSSGTVRDVVPETGTDPNQMDRVADQTFQRYSSSSPAKRSGNGVAIVWFKNDLRVLDNEALYEAWISSREVLPVFCVDPRIFGSSSYYFGFPKTGALRAQFLMECLADLRKNLMKRGLNLLIQHGKPEDILPTLAKTFGAHTVYAQKETCSEELNVEKSVSKSLQKVALQPSSGQSNRPGSIKNPKLQLVWGATMYHIDDLPFNTSSLPDGVFLCLGFVNNKKKKLQAVEAKCKVRSCIKIPASLGPPPSIDDWGCVPSIEDFGLSSKNVSKGMKFIGGESAALSRVYDYFWEKDLLRNYKETRNGMLGPDYSTKFSPWLASGSVSPRLIHEEVVQEKWRRGGAKITNCLNPGEMNVELKRLDKILFWCRYPLIDANMKELAETGFMSNRGRQIVCSFLVRDMGIDWRMGAEWFETCLLDYDPGSNYGNWTYGAGVGNDPREDRYFSIPKQVSPFMPLRYLIFFRVRKYSG